MEWSQEAHPTHRSFKSHLSPPTPLSFVGSPDTMVGSRSDPTQGPGGMVSLSYKGGMPPATVLKSARPISLEARSLANSPHGEICLFLDREEADGAAESRWETTMKKKREDIFLKQKAPRETSGLSAWLVELTCRDIKVRGRGIGCEQNSNETTSQLACKKPTNPKAEEAGQANAKPHG